LAEIFLMVNTFGKPIIPADDKERVDVLASYQILDTQPEGFFNNLAQIMARCFDTPIALISLVDKERVFFKANVGLADTQNVSRGMSLCSLAILDHEPTVFENALKEPCLLANPLVAGEFGLRFYAGAPITNEDGYNLGTVCVVDKKPRVFSQSDKDLLSRFAQTVMKALEKRKSELKQPN
jgi:GAF domain-containing protein